MKWSCVGLTCWRIRTTAAALVEHRVERTGLGIDGGDARYVGDEALIEIQIPTTPARFRESLAHELAHHVERTCDDFDELQAALRPEFGGSNRPWTGGDVWEEIPSELWAEGVVLLLNGERLLHGDNMPIGQAAIDSIAAWGSASSPAG